jgi:hypothetical protein
MLPVATPCRSRAGKPKLNLLSSRPDETVQKRLFGPESLRFGEPPIPQMIDEMSLGKPRLQVIRFTVIAWRVRLFILGG